MRPHLGTLEATASGHGRLGWIAGIFLSSLVVVLAVIVAAAWVVGGRVAAADPTVQELLPPEPRQDPHTQSGEAVTMTSGLQPLVGVGEEYVADDSAMVLPGARQGSHIREIPVESITALKSMGWAVPYLSRSGFEHEYVETTSLEGVRTIQARLSSGDHYINVAETRTEGPEVELTPLRDKLHEVVNLDRVVAETVELATGQEANLYLAEEGSTWTAAVESATVQYVITSDMPTDAASEVSSWVMVTDRSRVQMLPSSPGTADRLERGFEEMFAFFDT